MVLRYVCRVIVRNEEQFKKIFKYYPINEIGRLGCRLALETAKIIDVSLLYLRSEGVYRSKKLVKRMKSKMIEEYNIAKEEHRQATGKHTLNSVTSKHIKYAFINVCKHNPLYDNKMTSSFLYEPKKTAALFMYKRKLDSKWKRESKPSFSDTVLSHILNKISTKCQQYLPTKTDKSLIMPVALNQQYKNNPINSKLLLVPADLSSISPSLTGDSGVNYNYNKMSSDYLCNRIDVLNNTNQLLRHSKLENVVFHHIKSANLYKPQNTKMSDPKTITKQFTTLKTHAVVTNLISRPSVPKQEISNIFNENRYKYYNTEQETIGRKAPLNKQQEREEQSFEKIHKKKLEWIIIDEKKNRKEIRVKSTQTKKPCTNVKVDSSFCFSKPGLVPVHYLTKPEQKWNCWYELPGFKSAESEFINEFEKKLISQRSDNYYRSSANSPRIMVHSKEKMSNVLRSPTPTTSLGLYLPQTNNNKVKANIKVSEEISVVKEGMSKDLRHTKPESSLGLYFGQKKDNNLSFNVKSPQVISQEKQVANSNAELLQKEENVPSNATSPLVKSEEQQKPFNDVRYIMPESSLRLNATQKENKACSDVKSAEVKSENKEATRNDVRYKRPESALGLYAHVKSPDDKSEIEEETSHDPRYIRPESSLGLNSPDIEDKIHANIKPPEVRSDTNVSASNNIGLESTESNRTREEKNLTTTQVVPSPKKKTPNDLSQGDTPKLSDGKSLQVIHSDADKFTLNNSPDISSYTRPKSALGLYSNTNYLPMCFLKIGSEIQPATSSGPTSKIQSQEGSFDLKNEAKVVERIQKISKQDELSELDKGSTTKLNEKNKEDKNSTSFWPDLWMKQTYRKQFDESYAPHSKTATKSTKSTKREDNNFKKLG